MSVRVHTPPPSHADLVFIRNRTGRVHIRPHFPEPGDEGYEEPTPIPAGTWAEHMIATVTGPGFPMLCGQRVKYGYPGAPGDYAGDFADKDLCVACVRALGEDQWRAFHAENRSAP